MIIILQIHYADCKCFRKQRKDILLAFHVLSSDSISLKISGETISSDIFINSHVRNINALNNLLSLSLFVTFIIFDILFFIQLLKSESNLFSAFCIFDIRNIFSFRNVIDVFS